MIQNQQYVTIKGTKDGFTVILDDRCSYGELLIEIEEKLSVNTRENEDNRLVPVCLEIGNRYLTSEQEETIKKLIRSKKNLSVEKINSNVITKQEAEKQRKANQIITLTRMIRSGQIVTITGDLLLIGDVNPGAKVVATGNIYVLGALRGFAHAGSNGNKEAVIVTSKLETLQLKISDVVSQIADDEIMREMECAYIDEESNQITLDRLQTLPKIRQNLTKLSGRENPMWGKQ